MEVKLSSEVISFLSMGTKIVDYNTSISYYHFPFWIKEENGEFELFGLDKLPIDLIQKLQRERGASNTVYYFKDKPYEILYRSKMKTEDFFKLAIGSYNEQIGNWKSPWTEVVIYKCLYYNPDGEVWVREINEFFEKFKAK